MSDRPPDQRSLEALADAYVLARAARMRAIAAAVGPVDLDLTPTPENLFRWAWRLGKHGTRSPTNREYRKLRRKVGDLVAGRRGCSSVACSQPGQEPEPGSYEFMMDFLDLIFESAGWPEVSKRLRNAPLGQRLPRLKRLRASRIGNGKSLEVRSPKSTDRAARAVQLHVDGLSNSAIAKRLQINERTVERALKGNRVRPRTGRKRGQVVADICGPSDPVRPVELGSDRV